jgi:hypothetical protein
LGNIFAQTSYGATIFVEVSAELKVTIEHPLTSALLTSINS